MSSKYLYYRFIYCISESLIRRVYPEIFFQFHACKVVLYQKVKWVIFSGAPEFFTSGILITNCTHVHRFLCCFFYIMHVLWDNPSFYLQMNSDFDNKWYSDLPKLKWVFNGVAVILYDMCKIFGECFLFKLYQMHPITLLIYWGENVVRL